MATKKCIHGHLYDATIYGDNCPFCPNPNKHTHTIGNLGSETRSATDYAGNNASTEILQHIHGGNNHAPVEHMQHIIGNNNHAPGDYMQQVIGDDNHAPVEHMQQLQGVEDRTIIRMNGDTNVPNPKSERRLVGLLISYSANPSGDYYKIYEGRTIIGRDKTCDIALPNDPLISSKHFLIQYINAKGIFKAKDQGSSNGSYVNGQIYVMDESIELKNNDIIILGGTKFVFLAIPEF